MNYLLLTVAVKKYIKMNEDFTWFCPGTYEILSPWNVTIAQQRKTRDTLIVHHNGPWKVHINYKRPSANHILWQ